MQFYQQLVESKRHQVLWMIVSTAYRADYVWNFCANCLALVLWHICELDGTVDWIASVIFFGRCGDNCIFGDHSQFVQHAAFWYSKGGVFFRPSFSAVVCLYCTYWNLQHHPEWQRHISSFFSSSDCLLFQEKQEGRMGTSWRCCALHNRQATSHHSNIRALISFVNDILGHPLMFTWNGVAWCLIFNSEILLLLSNGRKISVKWQRSH